MKRFSSNKATRPLVLSIAGSDSAGLAGIQMDSRTIITLGGHAATSITANTAQNNTQVASVNPVSADVLKAQLDATTPLPIEAIKIGLIADIEQVSVICDFLDHVQSHHNIPVIYDPVLFSTSGNKFADKKILVPIKRDLLPRCTLLTPNIDEAEWLTQVSIQSCDDMIKATEKLHELGVKNVLLKGGHRKTYWSQDYFSSRDPSNIFLKTEQQQFWLSSKRIETINSRGTGCALSSTIATAMALGYNLEDSVVIGKMAINQGLRLGYSFEADKGPISIQAFPDRQIDLPCLTHKADFDFDHSPFPECNKPVIGLYPVIESYEWLKKVIEYGATTVQVRVKDKTGQELEAELIRCIHYAKHKGCRLFVNDYWQLAIKHEAYGVHLGQEDLADAEMHTILKSGLRLGISTHCHYEVARAHAYKPSYIACGPVFHTNTKDMPWRPHDLNGLNYWRKVLNYPLVAIGGINQERFNSVRDCDVDGIAMITAITLSDNPQTTTENYIHMFEAKNNRNSID